MNTNYKTDFWEQLTKRFPKKVEPPSVGIEPTTIGLKGQRSTIWAKKAALYEMKATEINDGLLHSKVNIN